jgi:hypothetical protein
MPIAVLCPTCSARLNAPDASAGKKVKCPKCRNPMIIPGPAAAPVPPPPPPRPAPAAPPPAPAPAPPAGALPFDFDAAASSGRKTGRRPPDPEALDLDDNEPPPARRGPGGRKPSRPRDEDDEDDRPRRRQPARTGGPPLVLILVLVGVLGLFCVGGVGVGAYFLFVEKDDTTAGTAKATAPHGGGTAKAAVPAGWKEFRPADGGFRAYFPSEPTRKGAAGLTIYSSQSSQQKVLCQLLVTRLSDVPAGERSDVVDEVVNGMARAPGARQLSRQDVRLAGQPATEVVIELPDAAVKGPKRAGGKAQLVARILKTDTTVYAMTISNTEPGRPSDALVNGFFDNFAVVD